MKYIKGIQIFLTIIFLYANVLSLITGRITLGSSTIKLMKDYFLVIFITVKLFVFITKPLYVKHVTPYTRGGELWEFEKKYVLKQNYFLNQSLKTLLRKRLNK